MQKRKKDPQQWRSRRITFNKTTQRYTPSKSLCMKMMPKRPRQKAVWSVYLSLTWNPKKHRTIRLSLDPIAHEPNPKGGFAVNGISTIQYYAKNQLVIVERSYSVGRQVARCIYVIYQCHKCKRRCFVERTRFYTSIKKIDSEYGWLRYFIDNIEGVTFVQNWLMANSSAFVSDNNFSIQKTQVLLLKWTKTVFFKLLKLNSSVADFRSYFKETEFQT
jgi:hypothetical protein